MRLRPMLRRSWSPKRPAATGRKPARLDRTQSRSDKVSNVSARAAALPPACATSARTVFWSGAALKEISTVHLSCGPSKMATALSAGSRCSAKQSAMRRAVVASAENRPTNAGADRPGFFFIRNAGRSGAPRNGEPGSHEYRLIRNRAATSMIIGSGSGPAGLPGTTAPSLTRAPRRNPPRASRRPCRTPP